MTAPVFHPWNETVRILCGALGDDVSDLLVEAIADQLAEHGLIAGDRDGNHVYRSTSCHHSEHGHCSAMVGTQGEKRPGRCKWCEAVCRCPSCRHGAGQGEETPDAS